jgi:hypothetical protein
MRSLLLVLVACGSSAEPPAVTSSPAPVPESPKPAPKPPDSMDERMRHCPLALDGATTTLEDIDGGVRFTIRAPAVAEVRKRAHHIVDFAARKTREGHGGFDGKGGGRMKNCPVVTDEVTITATDLPDGARLDVVARGEVAQLRQESRARAEKFPFVGATIKYER